MESAYGTAQASKRLGFGTNRSIAAIANSCLHLPMGDGSAFQLAIGQAQFYPLVNRQLHSSVGGAVASAVPRFAMARAYP